MKRSLILLASLAMVLSSTTALADEEALPPPAPAPAPLPPPHSEPLPPLEETPAAPPPRTPMEPFRVSAGFKIGYVGTRGFDTFADSNTLPQFSVDGTYAFWNSGRLALAAGLGWDGGGRGDKLRGLETSLTMHRFLVPIEARVSVTPWIWGFGKIAPGAALVLADIQDPSSPNSLSDSGWAFATDVSAGATFAIGKRDANKRSVRVLLTPEIGYSLTTAAKLRPNPGREDDELLGADADMSLRSVALSGFFWRATIGVAF